VQTFRAAVLVAPRTFEVQRRDLVDPRVGEVRLRVERTGVCGTDLALWGGGYVVPLPLVPGHEIVARVDEVGPGAGGWTVGERVVPEINATCIAWGRDPCPACAAGLDRHCPTRTVVGIDRHDGGFAEVLYVPAGSLHRVPDAVSHARAAFTEPVAAAFQTFEMGGSPEGRRVVVLGPGRLGVLVVAVARSLGARVAAVARSQASLDRALRFGAELGFLARDPDLVRAVRAWSGGAGAHMVVECTGDAGAVDRAMDLVRPRGTLAVKSTPGVPGVVALTRLVVDEIRLQGSRCGDFDKALAWLSATSVPVEDLVEATFSLDRVGEALEAASRLAKVMVRPGG